MLENSTAVHYVNKSGGSKSEELCRISSEIVAWCEPRTISVNAVYLPGAQNVIADRLSRAPPDSSDWKLNPATFGLLRAHWSPKENLLASARNRQLEQFVSWGH
jgi:hypothetical protein